MLKKIVDGSPLATLLSTLARSAQREAGQSAGGAIDTSTSAHAVAQPSLAELYDRYAQSVYRCLIGLGVSPSLAEDAMQDGFIIANRHLPAFQGVFHRAWLFQIARSVALNVRRSQRRSGREPLDLEILVDPASSPFDQAARTQQVRLLNQLLDQLSERQREVFVLAELEQLTQAEIAQALEVHVNTVANRLAAARTKLERLLRRHHESVAKPRRRTS